MSKVTGGRAMRAMGSEKKEKGSTKKKVHRMEIRHANGGFVVTHHAKPAPGGMMSQEPEEHVVPDVAALQSHVADNMGEPEQSAGPDQAAQAAAPAQGEPGQ